MLFVSNVVVADENPAVKSYIEQLEQADDLRLSNVSAFRQKLGWLSEYSHRFSTDEMDYFTLLKASEFALLSDFDKTTSILESRLAISDNEIFKVRAIALLVNSYVLAQNYSKAFEYFELLVNEGRQLSEERAIVQRLGVIALLYIKLEKFDLAQYYLKDIESLNLSEVNLCRLYTQKVEAMSSSSEPTDFDQASEFGVNLCINNNERVAAGFIVAEIIRYNTIKKQFDKAISSYEKYREIIKDTNYAFLIAKVNALVSQAYFAASKPEIAESLAKQALIFSGDRSTGIPVIEASQSLYEITKSQRRYKEALDYLELFNNAKNEYNQQLSAQLLAFHLARGEIEVKNQNIALLNKDNEVLFLQKNLIEQEVKQNRLIMLVLMVLLLFLVILAYRGIAGRHRFKKIAEYDQLTGVSNRYHFNNQAQVALEYCEKNAKPVAVILFDLDHFKNINDEHGHATGDWALQAVVKTCRNFMRNNDVFGRIGGEEFAVVLPGCQTDKAVLLAEICRDAIASIDTVDSGKAFSLSGSFGVSGSDISGYQLKQLLADADAAMYRAKEAGRNQVATFSG